MTNTNEWRVNDGTVPECVGPDTVIEVWYRNGDVSVWSYRRGNDDPSYWTIDDCDLDIIRWRFV